MPSSRNVGPVSPCFSMFSVAYHSVMRCGDRFLLSGDKRPGPRNHSMLLRRNWNRVKDIPSNARLDEGENQSWRTNENLLGSMI